jgi:hypothetical protein
VKGYKSKDNVDGNEFMAWERLKNMFEPVTAQEDGETVPPMCFEEQSRP